MQNLLKAAECLKEKKQNAKKEKIRRNLEELQLSSAKIDTINTSMEDLKEKSPKFH